MPARRPGGTLSLAPAPASGRRCSARSMPMPARRPGGTLSLAPAPASGRRCSARSMPMPARRRPAVDAHRGGRRRHPDTALDAGYRRRAAGRRWTRIVAAGGGTRIQPWMQAIADAQPAGGGRSRRLNPLPRHPPPTRTHLRAAVTPSSPAAGGSTPCHATHPQPGPISVPRSHPPHPQQAAQADQYCKTRVAQARLAGAPCGLCRARRGKRISIARLGLPKPDWQVLLAVSAELAGGSGSVLPGVASEAGLQAALPGRAGRPQVSPAISTRCGE